MKGKKIISAVLGMVLCFGIGVFVGGAPVESDASDRVPFIQTVFVNGDEIPLKDSYLDNGRTYVQLRELCGAVNVDVDWVDPQHHPMIVPGGNMLEGINLTSPTFVYTKEIRNWVDESNENVECVEITGLMKRYGKDSNFKYRVAQEGLYVTENGKTELTAYDTIPYMGRYYVPADQFKEKVQPLLTDICMQ